jgi:hypothetical protein
MLHLGKYFYFPIAVQVTPTAAISPVGGYLNRLQNRRQGFQPLSGLLATGCKKQKIIF